jgi:tetratricopeptide (TPR) repeat protein
MISFYRKYPTLAYALIGLVILLVILGVVLVPHVRSNSQTTSVIVDPKSVDGQITTYTKAIDANPDNVKSYINLSQVYLQKVRETADASYYQKISDLLDRAEKIDASNSDILATRASVELGRHHFKEGNAFAKKAVLLSPNNHLNYGLVGDSEIELGQYTEAVDAFQKMTDIRPDYSSYVRIAYIRELYGDIQGAKDALNLAIGAGSSFKENIAFAYVELGKLDMRNSLDVATSDFESALRTMPEYPTALEGLGKVAFFKADKQSAKDYFQRAYNKLPIVQYATDLGDLATVDGDATNAKQYYTLATLAFEKSKGSGVDTDLEESLFLADHNLDLPKALEEAKRAYVDRPSIYAADYLAWTLYKNGDISGTLKYQKEALRLGETDALILFHEGEIAKANGDKAAAKRLLEESIKANPYFSVLDAPIAKAELANIK